MNTFSMKNDASAHAIACVNSCDGWDEETLSHNIESNFPGLSRRDCDDIAEEVLLEVHP